MAVNYMLLTIICNALAFICEFYLDVRQSRVLKTCMEQIGLPDRLQQHIDREEFQDMQTYSILRLSFSRLESAYGFLAESGAVLAGVLVWMQSVADNLVVSIFQWAPSESKIITGVIFLLLASVGSAIMKAPFEIYRIVVIDSKFLQRDNTSVLMSWIGDQIKISLLAIIVGMPLLSLILKLIWLFDPVHWVYVWIGSVACAVFVVELYPVVLAPMFFSVSKLPDGSLRSKILEMSKRIGFPAREIEYITASASGSNANAFIMGFGKQKRIVLYDGLFEQLDEDEVLAILAHEMGHYCNNHNLKVLLFQAFSMAVFLFGLSQIIYNVDFYKSFGFNEVNPSVGLLLFSHLYQPIGNIFSVISNVIQRGYEYQCDRFAIELGYDVETPLIKIHIDNIYNIISDKHYSRYYNSHPCLMERIEKIAAFKKTMRLRNRLGTHDPGKLQNSHLSENVDKED